MISKKQQEEIDKLIKQFVQENPGVTYEEFTQITHMIATVASLSPPLFARYRDSGKSVEEVFGEISPQN